MAATDAAPDHDLLFKVLLIGDSGVGKSNLLLRFVDDDYRIDTAATIGVDFKVCTRTIEDRRVKMTLWDTAGQEKFRTITCSYYRGAHGIIVVYDITDRASFEHARGWMQEIEKYAGDSANRLLVGNKCDLHSKRVVDREEGRALAEELGVHFMETSARNAHNVNEAFDRLAQEIKARVAPAPPAPLRGAIPLSLGRAVAIGSSGGCCN